MLCQKQSDCSHFIFGGGGGGGGGGGQGSCSLISGVGGGEDVCAREVKDQPGGDYSVSKRHFLPEYFNIFAHRLRFKTGDDDVGDLVSSSLYLQRPRFFFQIQLTGSRGFSEGGERAPKLLEKQVIRFVFRIPSSRLISTFSTPSSARSAPAPPPTGTQWRRNRPRKRQPPPPPPLESM